MLSPAGTKLAASSGRSQSQAATPSPVPFNSPSFTGSSDESKHSGEEHNSLGESSGEAARTMHNRLHEKWKEHEKKMDSVANRYGDRLEKCRTRMMTEPLSPEAASEAASIFSCAHAQCQCPCPSSMVANASAEQGRAQGGQGGVGHIRRRGSGPGEKGH